MRFVVDTNHSGDISNLEVVMTAKTVVTDDTLGKIATRQWELYRRVKDGSLDPNQALSALQGIIENEADLLDIETMDWRVSSQVYEIDVEVGEDFPTQVTELGYEWAHNGPPISFTNRWEKSGKRRFRLAVLTRHPSSVGAIRIYADRSGFDLATAWELLAFTRYCPSMRIVTGDLILAAGNFACWEFPRGTYYAHVTVRGVLPEGPSGRQDPVWGFDTWNDGIGSIENPENLARAQLSNGYHVLLRERDQ